MSKRWQNGKYFSPRFKGEYLKMGPNDIGKKSIPKKDRCEDFDRIWQLVANQVMEYWDFVPVTDIHEFDQYQKIED